MSSRRSTQSTLDDADLVRRARSGENSAFDQLVVRYQRRAASIAFRLLGDLHDALEVCQDAFVRAWERRVQCRQPDRFRAWLMAITRSVAYNRLDAIRRRRLTSFPDHAASSGRTPYRNAEIADLRSVLQRGLATLTDGQREVLVLRDLEGWRHGEIAHHLGISETMSRRHLSDGRKAMRAFLASTEVTTDE